MLFTVAFNNKFLEVISRESDNKIAWTVFAKTCKMEITHPSPLLLPYICLKQLIKILRQIITTKTLWTKRYCFNDMKSGFECNLVDLFYFHLCFYSWRTLNINELSLIATFVAVIHSKQAVHEVQCLCLFNEKLLVTS